MDINPGDVVVCVDDSPRHVSRKLQIVRGRLYRVAAFSRPNPRDGALGFILHGVKALHHDKGFGFYTDRFRKIDAADDEFIAQIKSVRPVREDA